MALSTGPEGEMVVMCTGLGERQQNKLYLKVQGMKKSQLVRDKVAAGMYESRTTLLVVGATLGRTDKLLCALAAGVPIVQEDYVNNSHKAGFWLKEVGAYDVGRLIEHETRNAGDGYKHPFHPVFSYLTLPSGCSSPHWR